MRVGLELLVRARSLLLRAPPTGTVISSKTRRPSYIPTLDGWRAVAILLVLVDHSGDSLLRPTLEFAGAHIVSSPADFQLLKELIGTAGVHLFFGLSGYLITTNLRNEEVTTGAVSLKTFYLRRLFRIQPASLAFLLVIALLGLTRCIPVNPFGWLSAALGFANLTSTSQTWYTGHFWSLAVEEHFYLLWPALFVALSTRRFIGALTIACVDAIWRVTAQKYHLTLSPNFWVRTDVQLEWLMWGCFAAIARCHRLGLQFMQKLSAPWLSLISIPLLALTIVGSFTGMDWKIQQLLESAAAATTPLLFVGTASRPDVGLGRLLEMPLVSWVGRISFSIYLWQQLFIVWSADRAPSIRLLQLFPVSFIMAIVVGALSYYGIERPLLAVGKRYIQRHEHPARRIS